MLACGAALSLPGGPASAHGRSVSYSAWRLDEGGATVSARIALVELTRLRTPIVGLEHDGRADPDAIPRYLTEHLRGRDASGDCPLAGPPISTRSEPGWVAYRWSIRCAGGAPTRIESTILLDEAPSHLHFARLVIRAGERDPGTSDFERVLTDADREWILVDSAGADDAVASSTRPTSLAGYIVLGIEHILSGWDHLAFVTALLLLAPRLGELARLVTGFTLGHSLTLALAVLGWLRPDPDPVEAIIGYSVALVAAENAWIEGGRPRAVPRGLACGLVAIGAAGWLAGLSPPLVSILGLGVFTLCHFALIERSASIAGQRTMLAFVFGLVHGFGFAGVLAELSLPTDRLATALLGFNVGVEIGQILVVLLVWPLLRLLPRLVGMAASALATRSASAAIAGTGVYWFVVRALGPG